MCGAFLDVFNLHVVHVVLYIGSFKALESIKPLLLHVHVFMTILFVSLAFCCVPILCSNKAIFVL